MDFIPNLKEVSKSSQNLSPGHRLCPGCGQGIINRLVAAAIDDPVVIANATGCLEICTSGFPYSSWDVPWIHVLFENTAAVASGVEAMKKVLAKKGKLTDKQKKIKVLAFGGDGGTYDIGFQALSGAVERGHDFTYVCFDNGGYMNTGGQRSSATPYGGKTTTSPVGKVIPGKQEFRKDLTRIMAAHHLPYVAQAAPSNWADFLQKVRKAVYTEGPTFINAMSVCPLEWKSPEDQGMKITQLAVDTCYWPLYEVEKDTLRLTYRPKEKLPVTAFLENQGRFKHLFKPENKHMIEALQKEVDRRWELLVKEDECNKK